MSEYKLLLIVLNASSDILLEQSTIGASPNVKLLDYLKYAVYSQVKYD